MTGWGLLVFVLRRLAVLAVLLVVISFVSFSLLYISPGNLIDILLGARPHTAATVQALTREYHLNESFLAQYWLWARQAVQLHFGTSIQTSLPVTSEITARLPVSMFLYTAYIRSIPSELDEAARLDGAGPITTFWRIILPLMRPAVVTAVILHTIGVWTDFVNPQIVLGPASGVYTITTSVYAAIGRYSTDFTVVYPNLLIAVAPVLVFFVFMQRNIVSGLTSGATKG